MVVTSYVFIVLLLIAEYATCVKESNTEDLIVMELMGFFDRSVLFTFPSTFIFDIPKDFLVPIPFLTLLLKYLSHRKTKLKKNIILKYFDSNLTEYI